MEKHLNPPPLPLSSSGAEWIAWRVRGLLAEDPRPRLTCLEACIESALAELSSRHLAAAGPLCSWRTWRTRRQGLRLAVAGLAVDVRVAEVRQGRVQLALQAPRGVTVEWLGSPPSPVP